MTELLKFVVFVASIIAMMYLIGYGSRRLAMKTSVNPKIVTGVAIAVVFLICSFAWSFTGFYEWLSGVIGIPLENP
jgi:hypothetical protein